MRNKPTPEELQAKIEDAITSVPDEELKDEGEPEEVRDVNPVEEVKEEETEKPVKTEEQADPSEEAKLKLKTKLSASARENQKIYAKNRLINQALADADKMPEPTEEEMSSQYPNWNELNETEKVLLKETLVSKKWRAQISEARKEAEKIEKWNESVDDFVDNPQTLIDSPDLEGKTKEFAEFAKEESNNSVPLNILVAAFLHNNKVNSVSNRGKMFEISGGGPNDNPKGGKITLEESRKLRETDYYAWKEALKNDKIERNV